MLHQNHDQPFWRSEPFTEHECNLVEALCTGHRKATFRQNISSEVVKAAMIGSGDFNQAVAAGVSTLGGTHAPITQAYEFLKRPSWSDYTSTGRRIPGWGNSFVKGKPDEIWKNTHELMTICNPSITWTIDFVTNSLHEAVGKKVYPNAACYTAATAILLDLPIELSPVLVHYARLMAWAELCYNQIP